ncbi:uncharacterized protein LOC142575731 isoform X3 [Dermacentor variabilis]|uniref:uncharacterized protein LOC142575731 isoform X3 n=1 Tax=Dermacentor variabilis TaxID=34621 RepID=UPI003F5C320C
MHRLDQLHGRVSGQGSSDEKGSPQLLAHNFGHRSDCWPGRTTNQDIPIMDWNLRFLFSADKEEEKCSRGDLSPCLGRGNGSSRLRVHRHKTRQFCCMATASSTKKRAARRRIDAAAMGNQWLSRKSKATCCHKRYGAGNFLVMQRNVWPS